MKLTSLSLSAFKSSLRTTKLELAGQSGLVLVTGRNEIDPELAANGVGKTTLFDAVCFALYGRTGRGAKGPSLVSSQGQGPARVEVKGEATGKPFEIVREQSPNKLTLDSQIVTQYEVDARLGLNYDEFLRCCYHVQGSIGFVGLKPQPMLDELSSYLDLAIYDEARTVAGSRTTAAAAKVVTLQSGLASDRQLCLELREQATELAEQAHSASRERLQAARRGMAERREAQGRLEAAQRELDLASALLGPIPSDGRLRALVLEEARAEAELKGLRRRRDELKNAGADEVCPTCGQPWNNAAHIAEELTKIRAQIVKLKKKWLRFGDDAADEQYQYDTKIKSRDKVKQQIATHKATVAAAQDELDRLQGGVGDLSKERNRLEQLLKRATASLETLEDKIKTSERDLAGFTEQEAHFGYWKSGFKMLKLSVVADMLSRFQSVANGILQHLGMAGWALVFDAHSAVEIKGKLSVSLLHATGAIRSIDDLSFGELQRVKIACDMAVGDICLAGAGEDLNVEFWDEPTSWLSEQGVTMFLTMLNQRALSLNRRIFVADHRTLAHGWADVLTLTKTSEGTRLNVDGNKNVRPRLRA